MHSKVTIKNTTSKKPCFKFSCVKCKYSTVKDCMKHINDIINKLILIILSISSFYFFLILKK